MEINMNNLEPAYWEIKLRTGETVKLTLTFDKLYKLRSYDKSLYDDYTVIMNGGGTGDELDTIRLLYVAYVCTHMDEEHYEWEQFLMVVPYDRSIINVTIDMLLTPEKKKRDILQTSSGELPSNK